LNIPGEDAKGVLPGVDFLRRVNLGENVEVGEKVAVIGGGDVAIDAARMALRLGAREVSIVYRRTKEEMPANVEEVEEAEDEKIKILYLLAPTRILTDNGRAKGMECIRMELGDYDESGRRRPIPVKGSEFIMDVDTIIPEVGYKPELTCFKEEEGFKITRAGTLAADPITLATHIPGVFAGGDVVTGPSTIVQAMAHGYQAAVSIDRYLKGQDLYQDRVFRPMRRADVPKTEGETGEAEAIKPRSRMPYMGVGRRVRTFSEVNLGFSEETAIRESCRCLRCDLEH
jgi:NADPH-dependent glutamate synthase beta subunit-like oxidoreductase